MESRLNDGSYGDPAATRVKFAEVVEPWLAAQIHLKRSIRNRYRGVLDVHVIPRWGTTPLDRICFEDVAEWLGDMLSGEPTGGRKLSSWGTTMTFPRIGGWAALGLAVLVLGGNLPLVAACPPLVGAEPQRGQRLLRYR